MRKKAGYSKKIIKLNETELLIPPEILELYGYQEDEMVIVESRKVGSKKYDYIVPKEGMPQINYDYLTQAQLVRNFINPPVSGAMSEAKVIRILKKILNYLGESFIDIITTSKGEIVFLKGTEPFFYALIKEYDKSKTSYLRQKLELGKMNSIYSCIDGVYGFRDEMMKVIDNLEDDEMKKVCSTILKDLMINQLEYWDHEVQVQLVIQYNILKRLAPASETSELLKKEFVELMEHWRRRYCELTNDNIIDSKELKEIIVNAFLEAQAQSQE